MRRPPDRHVSRHYTPSRPLGLLLTLLLLENLTLACRRLDFGLHALGSLSRLVHVAALHDALDNLACVDVGEGVVADFAVDAHGLGRRVGVVGERDEGRGTVVHGVWETAR